MNQLVKSVKHIHVQQISVTPQIIQAIITYEPYPCDNTNIESQKSIINKLIEDKWFTKATSPEGNDLYYF